MENKGEMLQPSLIFTRRESLIERGGGELIAKFDHQQRRGALQRSGGGGSFESCSGISGYLQL